MINYIKNKISKFINETPDIKFLELKLLISNIIAVILIILLFRQTYHLAENINFEIQFRNYQRQIANPNNYEVTLNNSLGSNNPIQRLNETKLKNSLDSEPLPIPKTFKYFVGIVFFFVLNSVWYVSQLYFKFKLKEPTPNPNLVTNK